MAKKASKVGVSFEVSVNLIQTLLEMGGGVKSVKTPGRGGEDTIDVEFRVPLAVGNQAVLTLFRPGGRGTSVLYRASAQIPRNLDTPVGTEVLLAISGK